MEGDEIRVLDGVGEEVARAEEHVQLGGAVGEAPSAATDEGGPPWFGPVRELRERCPGPRWTVGEAGYDLVGGAKRENRERQERRSAAAQYGGEKVEHYSNPAPQYRVEKSERGKGGR